MKKVHRALRSKIRSAPRASLPEIRNGTRPKDIAMMDSQTRTTKPVGSRTDATQAFRETAENGSAQAKAAFEKASAAATDATTMMKDSYSRSVKGAQEYNTRVLEFARTNAEVAFDFAQELVGVKSPSEFFELSTNHSRKQFETLTEQAKDLAMLAQKVTLATSEPFKAGATRAFSQLS
ncbi:MAG: phasin [Pseudolabrys sp.]